MKSSYSVEHKDFEYEQKGHFDKERGDALCQKQSGKTV